MMKFFKVFLIAFFLTSCSSAPKKVLVKPYNLPTYKSITLKNGLEVLLIQNKKLPLIELSLLIPTGSADDSNSKQGLAYITGKLLKMGTLKRSASEISESFEQKGSSFSISVGDDFTMAEGSALSKFKNELFSDFIEVLTQPKFSLSEVNRFKTKLRAQNKKTLDNAGAMAGRAMNTILFKGHPYGNKTKGTDASIRRIKQSDISRFYKSNFQPEGATLAVIGDFEEGEVKPYLDQLANQWVNKASKKAAEFPEIKDANTKIHLVHKPDSKQSQIRFGHMGIARNNKDFIPLRVANAILGRGFSSRLLTEVRVKKGLTYTIGSSFNSKKNRGPFLINTFTRHDKVNETINTVLATVKTYLQSGVSDSELEVAKKYLMGTFPRALETSSSVAMNIMILNYHGVSLDYLKSYTREIDRVSKEDIQRVANKYIHPENLQIVVFSDKNKVAKELEPLGEVKHYSYKDFN